jgi:hypothetical protein
MHNRADFTMQAARRDALVLDIQTFINLYGYGYKNIDALGEAVDMDDPKIAWLSDSSGSEAAC